MNKLFNYSQLYYLLKYIIYHEWSNDLYRRISWLKDKGHIYNMVYYPLQHWLNDNVWLNQYNQFIVLLLLFVVIDIRYYCIYALINV